MLLSSQRAALIKHSSYDKSDLTAEGGREELEISPEIYSMKHSQAPNYFPIPSGSDWGFVFYYCMSK